MISKDFKSFIIFEQQILKFCELKKKKKQYMPHELDNGWMVLLSKCYDYFFFRLK